MSTPFTIAELAELLTPYHALFGQLSDEQIAEQLDLDTADVTRYRASLDAENDDADDAGEAAPPADDTLTAGDEDAPDSEPASALDSAGEDAAPAQVATVATSDEAQDAEARAKDIAAFLGREERRRQEVAGLVAEAVGRVLSRYVETGRGPGGKALQESLTAAVAEAVPAALAVVQQEAVAEAGPTPRAVRVRVRGRTIRGPDGKPWRLRRFDVYSGEQARWLWVNHRAMVERYPR